MARQIFDDEHEMFRDSVRSFMQNEIQPHTDEWHEQGIVDREAFRKAGEQGLLLMWADEKYGGAGVSDSDLVNGDFIVTAEGGTVTFNGGQFDYVAADGFFGIDTFEYTVEDQHGGSDTGLIRVTVLPDNGGPTADDDGYMINEDDGATAFSTVLEGDSDPDGDTLAAILVDPIATSLRRVDAGGDHHRMHQPPSTGMTCPVT